MANPYQLANIESERGKSILESKGQRQSSNIATGIKKGDLAEEFQKLIDQASDKPFSILDLIPGVGTIKDVGDRRRLMKKASNIDEKFGKTFLGTQSRDFKQKAKDLQLNPFEIGQNLFGDFMGADLMTNVFKNVFKSGTPIQSLIQNIEGMDFDKGGNMGRFNNLAVIQKILSNIGGKL